MPREMHDDALRHRRERERQAEITSDWTSNEVKIGATFASMISRTTRIATTPTVQAWRDSDRRSLHARGAILRGG